MSIFQIIATLFALFMLYVVNIHRRKLRLTYLEVAFWYSSWFVFIVIALFPELLLGITQSLQFARVFDLLVVVALMGITILVITNFFIQRENARKLEEVVRSIAMANKTSRQKVSAS